MVKGDWYVPMIALVLHTVKLDETDHYASSKISYR